MNRVLAYKDFVDELSEVFEFEYYEYGSSVGDPCFMTNAVGNDIVPTLTLENFDSVMVFINNFGI